MGLALDLSLNTEMSSTGTVKVLLRLDSQLRWPLFKESLVNKVLLGIFLGRNKKCLTVQKRP